MEAIIAAIAVCPILYEEFDDDPTVQDKASSHLPVQSSRCAHRVCYSCLMKIKMERATKEDRDPCAIKWIKCPKCRLSTCFNTEKPIVDLMACDLLRSFRSQSNNNNAAVAAASMPPIVATSCAGRSGNDEEILAVDTPEKGAPKEEDTYDGKNATGKEGTGDDCTPIAAACTGKLDNDVNGGSNCSQDADSDDESRFSYVSDPDEMEDDGWRNDVEDKNGSELPTSNTPTPQTIEDKSGGCENSLNVGTKYQSWGESADTNYKSNEKVASIDWDDTGERQTLNHGSVERPGGRESVANGQDTQEVDAPMVESCNLPSIKQNDDTTRKQDDTLAVAISEPVVSKRAFIFNDRSYETYQDMVNAKRQRNRDVLISSGLLEAKAAVDKTALEEKRAAAATRGLKRSDASTGPLPPKRKSCRLAGVSAPGIYVESELAGKFEIAGESFAPNPEEPEFHGSSDLTVAKVVQLTGSIDALDMSVEGEAIPDSTDPLVKFKIETMPSSIGDVIRLMDTLQPGCRYYTRQKDSRGECSGLRGKLRKYARANKDKLGVAHWVETKNWEPPSNEALSALMVLSRDMIDEYWPLT